MVERSPRTCSGDMYASVPGVVPVAGETRVTDLREAEVEQPCQPVAREHDVAGLDVPVHDAVRVRRAEGARELAGDGGRLARRQRTAAKPLLQRLALVQGHGDERTPVVGLADLVDRADVRVDQRGGGARLYKEALTGTRLVGHVRREELERDVAIEPLVVRTVHGPHAAAPDERQHAVAAERPPDHRVVLRRGGGGRRRGGRGRRERSGRGGSVVAGELARRLAVDCGDGGADGAPEAVEELLGGIGVLEQRGNLVAQRRVTAAGPVHERRSRVARQLPGVFEEALHLVRHTTSSRARDRSR